MMKRFALTAVSMLLASTASAQAWPEKPVTFVVPFAAGGPTDKVARDLAEALRKRSALKSLDLSFCGLKKAAANILVQALAQNESLEQVNLGGNPIPPLHPIFKDKRVVRIVNVKPGE